MRWLRERSSMRISNYVAAADISPSRPPPASTGAARHVKNLPADTASKPSTSTRASTHHTVVPSQTCPDVQSDAEARFAESPSTARGVRCCAPRQSTGPGPFTMDNEQGSAANCLLTFLTPYLFFFCLKFIHSRLKRGIPARLVIQWRDRHGKIRLDPPATMRRSTERRICMKMQRWAAVFARIAVRSFRCDPNF
jgi:hypothetical protein